MTILRIRMLQIALSGLFAVSAAGCVTYPAAELAGLSALELCELRENQGMNLSDATRRALDNELQRRSDDCRRYAAEVAARRAEALYLDMYGRQSP
jgi:hypothetical protein